MPRRRILIVEHDAAAACELDRALTLLGYERAGQTAEGEQAVALADQLQPDLVLINVDLAGLLDGSRTAQAIHRQYAIPVVLMMNSAEEATLKRAQTGELCGYIVRPFHNQALHVAIEMAIHSHRASTALRSSDELMRYIVKHDPNAIAVYDRQLRYVAVSDRYLQDYGVAAADVLGKHHYEVFPEMPQKWRDVHARCLRGAIERNDDDFFERPDGSITYNRWECRPWYETNGNIGGIVTYTEVTTGRKRAEIALRESEEFGRAVLNSVAAHIAVIDSRGVIVAVNEPWERFALENGPAGGGPAQRTGVGVNYLDICRESTGDSSQGAQAADDGIRRVLDGRLPSFTLEYPCHSPDQQRWFTMTVTPLPSLDRGVVVSHFDITSRKLAEEALQRERQRFYDILEVLPVMICLLTPDYRVPFANRCFRECFGESDGRHCYDYIFHRTEPCPECQSLTPLQSGVPHRWEWATPVGVYVDIYDFPFTDADGSPLILEMDVDITQRKRTEAQIQQQLQELRRWHKVTLGREHRILELKAEVNELLARLGAPPRYGQSVDDTGDLTSDDQARPTAMPEEDKP